MARVWRRLAPVALSWTVSADSPPPLKSASPVEVDAELENWSGTHRCKPAHVYRPKDSDELEGLLREAQTSHRKVRCVGSGLSPNGIGFSGNSLVNIEECNKVLNVDVSKRQVTVQAGVLVGELLHELEPYGFTLQNLASIALQQVGGFTQVGAHGTGARLPPVEEQIVSMKLVTPGKGTLTLYRPRGEFATTERGRLQSILFDLARCGLGSLGVVTEVTLQCVPTHKLRETTMVLSRKQAREKRASLIRSHRHVRYMWVPYSDTVVVVYSDEVGPDTLPCEVNTETSEEVDPNLIDEALLPLTSLLHKLEGPSSDSANFAELRDRLISAGKGPLSADHVRQVNQAEAEFWRRSCGTHVDDSENVLHFECGGQQWVWENCMPCGKLDALDDADMRFMENLLNEIETRNIPAPSPIEQRWTSGSTAAMSPASIAPSMLMSSETNKTETASSAVFSWIGIIMYMPSRDEEERRSITKLFAEYAQIVRDVDTTGGYDLQSHWAKLEIPDSSSELRAVKERLKRRFPIAAFNVARGVLDPDGVLSNEWTDAILSDA